MKYCIALTLACIALVPSFGAQAQTYPNRPIRLLVGYPPGGNQDAYARVMARAVEGTIGQQIVVDNRTGANGVIATDLVAKAVPDGYTLLHNSISLLIASAVNKNLPFDITRDLRPITGVAIGLGALLVVHPSVPAQSVKELIAYARTTPVAYGSPGTGNNLHVIAELFNVRADARMLHVPYKGAGPAMTALLGGEVQVAFLSPSSAIQHIKSGKLKALGYSGAERFDGLPDLPTITEAGLPGYQMDTGWHAWFAPAKLPDDILNKIYLSMHQALQLHKVREYFRSTGSEPLGEPPPQFEKRFRADMKRWGEASRLAKVSPE
ncbi:MAG: tripartite tricarboxylate transporter substrate binding protein [Betaproteobacteria bacterium]|nr:tripartite tricarboxylate transporter substrate binding protein [Betaproteobacteria bacterium]